MCVIGIKNAHYLKIDNFINSGNISILYKHNRETVTLEKNKQWVLLILEIEMANFFVKNARLFVKKHWVV